MYSGTGHALYFQEIRVCVNGGPWSCTLWQPCWWKWAMLKLAEEQDRGVDELEPQ